MKLLKSLLRASIGIIIVLSLFGLVLPQHAHVERNITIEATPAQIFPYVNDFREFNKWSPWAQIDPATVYEFTGPATGVGARMRWHSEHPHVGEGSQEIIESIPERLVKSTLYFGDQGDATASYSLEPAGKGALLSWAFDVDLGFNPLSRYFGLMLDSMVGANYEEGLSNLKTLIEGREAHNKP
jgi:uncharacterized protein YndB with AHSA1/START domain